MINAIKSAKNLECQFSTGSIDSKTFLEILCNFSKYLKMRD